MNAKVQTAETAAALRAVMRYRNFTMAKLAKASGVSRRTIEGYCYGRNSMAEGKAYNIVEIAHALNADPRIFTGSMSVEDFFSAEEDYIKDSANYPGVIDMALNTVKNARELYQSLISGNPEPDD